MHDDELIDALDLQNDIEWIENWTIEKAIHMYRNTIHIILSPRNNGGFFVHKTALPHNNQPKYVLSCSTYKLLLLP